MLIVLHWACLFLSFVGSILMLLVTIVLSHFTQLLGLLLIKEVIFIQRQHRQIECLNEKTRSHFPDLKGSAGVRGDTFCYY